VAAGLVALFAAGNAGAATPKEIYADLVDNGRLDRAYSRADLKRAFPPGLVRYSRPVPQRVMQSRPPQASPPSVEPSGGSSLPFTGLDAALFGAVGGPLLLLGAGMRRLVRVHEGKAT
jgi:hypothetical protein